MVQFLILGTSFLSIFFYWKHIGTGDFWLALLANSQLKAFFELSSQWKTIVELYGRNNVKGRFEGSALIPHVSWNEWETGTTALFSISPKIVKFHQFFRTFLVFVGNDTCRRKLCSMSEEITNSFHCLLFLHWFQFLVAFLIVFLQSLALVSVHFRFFFGLLNCTATFWEE